MDQASESATPDSPMAWPVRATGTAALLLLAGLNHFIATAISKLIVPLTTKFTHDPNVPWDAAFLVEAICLCLITRRWAGLGLGCASRWRRFAFPIAGVLALPPLLTLTVYAQLTDKPFSGMTWSLWLVQSIAQEFFFTGFVYGALARLHGTPSTEWRAAVHPALVLTAFAFMVWHWPNVGSLSPGYMAFQLAYTFLGACWTFQVRRWTGSIWPGVANHVLVNWLATRV